MIKLNRNTKKNTHFIIIIIIIIIIINFWEYITFVTKVGWKNGLCVVPA